MGKLAASHSGTPPLRTLTFMPFSQQLAGHASADELVRVGVVRDDVAAAGNGDRSIA